VNILKLVCPNLFDDVDTLKSFALDNKLQGIEWSLAVGDLPRTRLEEMRFTKKMLKLAPLEVRFHLFFPNHEIGHRDSVQASLASGIYGNALNLISKTAAEIVTVHAGFNHEEPASVSWDKTIFGLKKLVSKAKALGISLCLENLAGGWSGRPELYEKLLRKANCCGTLDIGHAKVCTSVKCEAYRFEDFAVPNADRILGAHIYHEERHDRHFPPTTSLDLEKRLEILLELPHCNWWVLELRNETEFMQTLNCVNHFLWNKPQAVAM
jgi:sugar phosphate isomerase/epimerase